MASPRKEFSLALSLLKTCELTKSLNNPKEKIRTTVTDLLKINHPIMLAGMNVAAGPKLAAAVTNAGGIGVIGGLGYTPEMLREQITELKSYLHDKNAPFGVDLLNPQVGGAARKTKQVSSPPPTPYNFPFLLPPISILTRGIQLRLHKRQTRRTNHHHSRKRHQTLRMRYWSPSSRRCRAPP